MLRPVHFVSNNGKFALCIPGELLTKVLERCSVAGDHETGGILVGKYTSNLRLAQVTTISDSPDDSVANHTMFIRGVRGLCQWLMNLWGGQSYYYLGEWHFHPSVNSQPSALDMGTMAEIASAGIYKCPEPVLLIVGRTGKDDWLLHAQVTTREGKVVALIEQKQWHR